MSQNARPRYAFRDGIPVAPVPPGTNVLVLGPSIGATRKFLMQLLAGAGDEGLLYLTLDRNADDVIDTFEGWAGRYDADRMGVVDCTQQATSASRANVTQVSSPSDLTGIGMQFSAMYERLYTGATRRIRTGLYSLSPLQMYVKDLRKVYRFLHTFTGRISRADGLGVFGLDPDAVATQTRTSIAQPFDGIVEIRKTESSGANEVRVEGLEDQPDGWQPFELRAVE